MSDGRTWGTIIGGVVGFFTGGIGFAAGAAIGGAVGGLLEPKKHTETNRIDDIKVSLSKYGDGIPETWGNNIPSATCVWSTYVIELPEEPTGGKGGGVENTNYRQYIESMWCLGKTPELVDGERPNVAIRRAWIDGKLNYDSSTGLSAGQSLATKENPWASVALLPGFDDQLPVPMIETYEGVGNVPAFRGRICLFIFGLEVPGGRIPQLQFEICIGNDLVTVKLEMAQGDLELETDQIYSGLASGDGFVYYRTDHYLHPLPYTVSPQIGSVGSVQEAAPRSTRDLLQPTQPIPVQGGELAYLYLAFPDQQAYDDQIANIYRVDAKTGTEEVIGTYAPEVSTHFTFQWAAYDTVSGKYVLASSPGEPVPSIYFVNGDVNWPGFRPSTDYCPMAFYDRVVSFISLDGETLTRFYVESNTSEEIATPVTGLIGTIQALVREDANGLYLMALDSYGAGGIWRWKGGEGFLQLSNDISARDGMVPAVYQNYRHFYADDTIAVLGPNQLSGGRYNFIIARFNVVQPNAVSVASIISSQSIQAGLSSDQFDVSTIDDEVWGLTFKSPASARSNIGPLLTFGAIGVVEEDGLLRYFHRADKAPVGTIGFDELGFVEDGQEPGDAFPFVRLNAQELPRSITVTYNDPNFDYQVSTVKAMRYAVDSVADESIVLDLAINGDQAATIARRTLFERWIAQTTRSCSVSRKFAYLSAGDVITVEYPKGVYSDWMTSKITDTGALIQIECFAADGELLIQTVPGPTNFRPQQIAPLAPATRMQQLDIPILRDVDNNAGMYLAFDGYAPNWPGGQLFDGDDDNSLTPGGAVEVAAPIGFLVTNLGDASAAVVDELNQFTINIGDDSFESVTRDVMLNGGGEFWACGAPGRWEIGCSAVGVDLGGGRFTLSRHVRGMFGTERCTGLHEVGDTFVLLRPPGMLRPNMAVGQIGQTRSYRAITKSRSINSAASQRYVNTGEGLKPLAPINLRRTQVSNDITLSWDRRSRLAMNYATGDVPLGEETEQYSVKLFTDGTYSVLAGTLLATTASITITAAQQTAMGLTPGARPYAQIRQISADVGEGYPLQGSGDGRASHEYWRIVCTGVPPAGDFAIGEVFFRVVSGGAVVTVGGTPLASGFFSPSFPPSNAFDGNATTLWVDTPPNSWIGYHFTTRVSLVEYGMQSTVGTSEMPQDFTLEGSDDGVNWAVADTRTGITWTTAAQNFSF